MKYSTLAAGLLMATTAGAQTPVLTVYTYDSFVAEWGPGPAVEAAFEETCGCDLKFVAAGDGAALLARVRLEGARTEADVVLGLDTNLTAAAADSALFQPVSVSADYDLPVAWEDDLFVPYDWGYFAFVYDKTKVATPPKSFEELAASDLKILIEDPRSSTPGLGLLLWVQAAYGDRAGEIWEALADMVLSYTTSPAYHLIAEDDATKAAAPFEEGHYLQVEVAGMIASTDEPELARAFLDFMVSDAFQSVIPTTNWMYPAVTPTAGLPEGFDTLIVPSRALLYPPREAAQVRDQALETWRAALSR